MGNTQPLRLRRRSTATPNATHHCNSQGNISTFPSHLYPTPPRHATYIHTCKHTYMHTYILCPICHHTRSSIHRTPTHTPIHPPPTRDASYFHTPRPTPRENAHTPAPPLNTTHTRTHAPHHTNHRRSSRSTDMIEDKAPA